MTAMSAVSVTAMGSVADTVAVASPAVIERVMLHADMLPSLTPRSFDNPAVMQWRQRYSYSVIAALADYDDASQAIDIQRGKGSSYWGFAADSYIKYGSSTLWGNAGYSNGRQRDVRWNESSDASLIYPYFTADSIGGDLNAETYRFAGGYADHNDRYGWGVAASYDAGLYYRNIDPRPRNTTSRLDIAAGASVRIGRSDYQAALTVNYRKYKQSCDIEFVNELSDNSIWHLTGLGTHYERFAGNGYSHYYNGHRWGAGADLFPSEGHGFLMSVRYSSFSFDHILTSLNKLPLQSAVDNSISATVGWLGKGEYRDRGATLSLEHGKRTGTENIFGDAAGNVYPLIGALDLYMHTHTCVRADFLWQWHAAGDRFLAVRPSAQWSRSRERYADPLRELLLSALTPAVTLRGASVMGRRWVGEVTVEMAYAIPLENSRNLPYDANIPAGMQAIDHHRFEMLSKPHASARVGVTATRSVNDRYALSISTSYLRGNFTSGVHTDCVNAALSFIF